MKYIKYINRFRFFKKNLKNIVSDIKIYWILFSKVERKDKKVSITVAYNLAQRDYIVNNDYDWVISKKGIVKQKIIKE